MKKNKVLFVCPKYDESRISGTSVRPIQMLQALKDVYGPENVVVAVGESSDRRKVYQNLDIDELDFVYMENSTMPLALTDVDHVPRNLLLEYRFFSKCRARKVPVFVFYRDIRWRFDFYRSKNWLFKRLFAYIFYILELAIYRLVGARLCMPSCDMADYVPLFSRSNVTELPPGSNCEVAIERSYVEGEKFQLLYVGGVLPPVYDLTKMLQIVSLSKHVEFVIVCRKAEWDYVLANKTYALLDNVKVVHESGNALSKRFTSAHALLDFRTGVEYLNFSMPIKIFESLGTGLPVICNGETAFGRYVRSKQVGWVYSDLQAIIEGVEKLVCDPEGYRIVSRTTYEHSKSVTWTSRIETIRDLI